MRRVDPIRIKIMPMRGTDREGQLLREGTRHLIYRGPLRIGEIEQTTAVHENGQEYGFRPGLAAMCLHDPECRYPTVLINVHFKTVAAAVKAIKQAEQQWLRRRRSNGESQQTVRQRETKRKPSGRVSGRDQP